jgi:hypothetical protein
MTNQRDHWKIERQRVVEEMPVRLQSGRNSGTCRFAEMSELLKRAAYLPLFSMPNPEKPDVPLSALPILTELVPALRNYLLIGMRVFEAPHRLEVKALQPTPERGLAAIHEVGEQIAKIDVHFAITPDNFEAGPGRVPPATLFLPFFSQRFSFPQGEFSFLDRRQSGFKGFGAGRTFPIRIRGETHIRIGGIIQILEGIGKFSDLQGLVVVNGEIRPPNDLALFMMPRIMDPKGILNAKSPVAPLQSIPDPDPTAAFFFFLAEPDPAQPITINRAGNGRILSLNLYERLRLVQIGFDISTSAEIRSRMIEGDVIGSHRSTVFFNPEAETEVTPFYSSNDVFIFFDKDGRTMGTLKANLVEGRAIRTVLSGARHPVFRIGAAGPFIDGTGQFLNAIGVVSVNGALSLNPNTLSSLYMLRVIDVDGRFRVSANRAWT